MKSASFFKLSLLAMFGLLTLVGTGCQQKSEYEDKPLPTGKPNDNVAKIAMPGGGGGPGGGGAPAPGAPAPGAPAAPPTSVKTAAQPANN